jgi:hypothetical protein
MAFRQAPWPPERRPGWYDVFGLIREPEPPIYRPHPGDVSLSGSKPRIRARHRPVSRRSGTCLGWCASTSTSPLVNM